MKKNSAISLVLIFLSIFSLSACSRWYAEYGIETKSQLYSKSSIPSLIEALKSDDANDRIRAMRTLALHKHDAMDAVPSLLNIVQNDPEEHARHTALNALKSIEPKYEDIIAVIENVRDNDSNENVRRRAGVLLETLSGNSPNKYNHIYFSLPGEKKSIELAVKPDFLFYNGYQKINLVRRTEILPIVFTLANNYPDNIRVDINEIQLTDQTGKVVKQVPIETVAEKAKFSYKKCIIITILAGPVGIPFWFETANANKKINSEISDMSSMGADIPANEKCHWYCFFNVNKTTDDLSGWHIKINFEVNREKYVGRVKFKSNYELLAKKNDLLQEKNVSKSISYTAKKKLVELKELLEENLITQDEYNSKREEILDEF